MMKEVSVSLPGVTVGDIMAKIGVTRELCQGTSSTLRSPTPNQPPTTTTEDDLYAQ